MATAWMRVCRSAPSAAALLLLSGCMTFDEPGLSVSVVHQSSSLASPTPVSQVSNSPPARVSQSPKAPPPRRIHVVATPVNPRKAAKLSLAEVRRGVIERTNQYRTLRGLPALKTDARLERAAQEFAEHMARCDDFGHHVDGRKAAQRAEAAGYGSRVWENIAYYGGCGVRAAGLRDHFFETWTKSRPHAANIEARGPRDIGIGIAEGPGGCEWYAVMMLGQQR